MHAVLSGRGSGFGLPRLAGRGRRSAPSVISDWFDAPAYADFAVIDDYNNNRHAKTAVSLANVTTATASDLKVKQPVIFADNTSLTAASTQARTYTDQGGVWRDMLTGYPNNKFTWGNDFTNAAWKKASASVGGNTLTATGTVSAVYVEYLAITTRSIVSAEFEAGTNSALYFQLQTIGITGSEAYFFDLATGTTGGSQVLVGAGTPGTAGISLVSPGRYRCWVVVPGNLRDVYFGVCDAVGNRNATVGRTLNIYNAQLDLVPADITTPRSYVPTTTAAVYTGLDAPRFTYADGKRQWRLENQATNKLTCRKHNPTDTTGLTKSGDAAATLSVVDDAAALASAGLSALCSNGKAYCLDNSLGATVAFANSIAQVGNSNTHTVAAYIRGGAGDIRVTLLGGAGSTAFSANAGYVWRTAAPPGPNAGSQWAITANAGQVIYFILPLMAEQAFAPDPIPGDTTTAVTRWIETAQDTAATLALVTRSAFSQVIRGALSSVASGTIWRIDDGTDNNLIEVTVSAGVVTLKVVTGGATVAQVSSSNMISANTPFGLAFRCAANNFQLCLNGTLATPDTAGAMPTGLNRSALARNLGATVNYANGFYDFRAIAPEALNDAALQTYGVAA